MLCYTGIKEIDLKIYLEIDDNILKYLFQTCSYIYGLRNDVWQSKICRKFPKFPTLKFINIAEEYFIIRDMSYTDLKKKFGDELNDWFSLPENKINIYIENGEYENIESCLKRSVVPCQKSIDELFSRPISYYRHLSDDKKKHQNLICDNMAMELLVMFGLYPSIDVAVVYGHSEAMLNLLSKGQYPSQDAVDKTKYTKILLSLAEYEVYQDIDVAIDNLNDKVINMLLRKGKRPTQNAVNKINNKKFSATGDSYAEILISLSRYDIYQDIDVAIKTEHCELLQKIIDNNKGIPSQQVISACRNDEVLLVLHRNGLWSPDEKFIDLYFSKGFSSSLRFLARKKVLIVDTEFLNKLIRSLPAFPGKTEFEDHINFMREFQISPDQSHIDLCFIREYQPIINFFLSRALYPSQEFIDNSCKNNNYFMIAKLSKHNLFPEQEFIDYAKDNNFKYIVDIMKKCQKI